MPHNPLTEPNFWYVAITIASVLLLGLAGAVIAERNRLAQLASSTLFLRVRSWAIIAPVFVLAVFAGGFLVFLLAAFVAMQGAAEYGRLVGLHRRYAWLLCLWILVGLLVAALARNLFLFLPLGFFLLLTLVPIITGEVDDAVRQLAGTLYGYLYIGLPMAYLVYIKAAEPWGREFLLVTGLAVALADVCAFIVGSVFKGPKLAPKVSPNKTWSGVLGSLLGACLGIALLSRLIPDSWTLLRLAILVTVLVVLAVWGDLAESVLKRSFATKDAGTLLPGFGGILDRVDSLLFVLPLGYYTLLAVSWLPG